MDYKEITKRHLEIMNSDFCHDPIKDIEYSSINTYINNTTVDKESVVKDSSYTYSPKIPYFFNFQNVEAPEDKFNIETHYLIPGSNSKILN
jgi:hypothetical protein